MKAFLRSLFSFSIFSIVAYIIVIIILGLINRKTKIYAPKDYGSIYFPLQQVDTINSPDILFLGSSHAHRGFNIHMFEEAGYKSFNFGSSSQTPIQTKLLMFQYGLRMRPKNIIYEVNPMIFSEDGVESALEILSDVPITRQSFAMALEINNYKTYNAIIYNCFANVFNLNKKELFIAGNINQTYYNGYVEKDLTYFTHKKYAPQNIHLNNIQLHEFDQTVKMITSHNINLILIQAPITPGLYNSSTNNVQFDSIMNSKGVPYFNFNKLITLDDSLHFYDSHHLNQAGVKVFNNKIIEILKMMPINRNK